MQKPIYQSADSPFTPEGKNYHLGVGSEDIAPVLLLPGDPSRVAMISKGWDTFKQVGHNREFVTHTGMIGGVPISALSTGIGNPSMATVVESLVRMGAKDLLRVGTTGCIQPDIELGDLIIAKGAVRLDGASKAYVCTEFPASAHQETVMALIQACEELGFSYHVGITASTDSFYLGQGRPGWKDYFPSHARNLIEDMQAAGVLNFEMETSALYTVSQLYGLRAGAIFAVIANRLTNKIEKVGVENAVAAANRAAVILHEMDIEKNAAGKQYWYPGLRSQTPEQQ